MIRASWTLFDLDCECIVCNASHTVPTGRLAFSDTFQAINCLATFIQSLRDQNRRGLSTKIDVSRNLPAREPFEDEDDDEDEDD